MAIGFKGGYTRKKEGSSVYFVNQNVKGKVKQVSRAYVSDIKNPKTLGQAKQRALFVAAKNFRRGFEGLLNHSWQGTKYGSPSLSKFMSLVMANKGAAYADFFYQPRNSMKFIPQPWPLSTGSVVGEISTQGGMIMRDMSYVDTNIFMAELAAESTIGDFSKAIIAAAPFLADGDMLTFCVVYCDEGGKDLTASAKYAPVFDRIVLDTTNTTKLTENFTTENGLFKVARLHGCLNLTPVNPIMEFIAAFGCIISRRNSVGTAYQRNNATLLVRDDEFNLYGGSDYRENCLRSMMDDSFLESTWYLNQVGYDQSAQGGNNIGNGGDDTTIENP